MFDIGEVSVLPVVELLAQVVLVDVPAAQGFDRDAGLGFDAEEVAVVLVEEVEGVDFLVEGVVGRHGVESFCVFVVGSR